MCVTRCSAEILWSNLTLEVLASKFRVLYRGNSHEARHQIFHNFSEEFSEISTGLIPDDRENNGNYAKKITKEIFSPTSNSYYKPF